MTTHHDASSSPLVLDANTLAAHQAHDLTVCPTSGLTEPTDASAVLPTGYALRCLTCDRELGRAEHVASRCAHCHCPAGIHVPGCPNLDPSRCWATFRPQEWIGDRFVERDDRHYVFDITLAILAMGERAARRLHDDDYETEELRPQWIRGQHHGPFVIECQQAIAAFFDARATAHPLAMPTPRRGSTQTTGASAALR